MSSTFRWSYMANLLQIFGSNYQTSGGVRACLVIVFKNCCLKRCENYGLKSIVEQRVFSVNKTKKCVWYHSLNNIF